MVNELMNKKARLPQGVRADCCWCSRGRYHSLGSIDGSQRARRDRIPEQERVTIERVTYPARNMGTTIVANLFKPAGFDANRKYAAIVVTHPFGGVKEQTSGLYAQHLAEQGFITLAYDASYQGESGGEPRLMEVPAQRLDDISCAIDFLVRHPQVDAGANRLTRHLRRRRLCAVQCHDRDAREGGRSRQHFQSRRGTPRRHGHNLLRGTNEAAEGRRRGAFSRSPGRAGATGTGGARQPGRFHGKHAETLPRRIRLLPHAAGPASELAEPVRLLELPLQMAFFPFEQLDTISPRPLLVIAGSKADTLFWSEDVIKKAKEPKELHIDRRRDSYGHV